MRNVRVPLGDRSYSIKIGTDLLKNSGKTLKSLGFRGPCAVISDDNVAPLYLDTVIKSLSDSEFSPTEIILPYGEKTKSVRHAEKCYDILAKNKLERKSAVIALGGGVIGDLAGFIASSYLRGVPFIQIPTTLLSQVDSSVGGKVGVNLKAGKNLVGAFYQPHVVLCDLDTLKSLPRRELRAGMAEVIKYGVIYDSKLFKFLEKNIDSLLALSPDLIGKVVAKCCSIKADVVQQDEKEGGLRAILNFGHTIGHAIEAISGYSEYLHGEAISIGMVKAGRLSQELTHFPSTDQSRLRDLLHKTGLPTEIKLTKAKKQKIIQAMSLDKKVQNGEVRFILAEKIGKVHFGCKVPANNLAEVLL